MKKILLFKLLFCFLSVLNAQIPQIALVRPSDNSTQIFTTFEDAYVAAQNDDFIYLPGGSFSLTTIDKRLNIYGAGYHPTESIVTGKTTNTNKLTLYANASGSHIEGVEFTFSYYNGNNTDSSGLVLDGCSNVSIINCKLLDIRTVNSSVNNFIKNNIFQSVSFENSIILNNIITGAAGYYGGFGYYNCTIKNNVFISTITADINSAVLKSQNSTIKDNIFLTDQPMYNYSNSNCGNIFQNNLKLGNSSMNYGGTCSSNPSIESSTFHVSSIDDIFVDYPTSVAGTFDFNYNYHLKPTSIGINAGTDGTDIGIYGSSFPCPDIRIPSNPHIYLKDVGTQSTTDGKLQVHYGVKKGSQ